MKNKKKIGVSILKYMVFLISITFLVLFAFIGKDYYDDAILKQGEISQKNVIMYSENMNKKFTSVQSTINAVELELKYLQKKDMTREEKIEILSNIMVSNENIVGGGIFIEDDLYDGQNAKHINTKYSDETGRFLPYFSHGSGNTANIEPLVDYNGEDWYEVPKKTHKKYITEPYDYEVNGKIEKMVTLSHPVSLDGSYAGIITADITLTFLDDYVKEISSENIYYEVISSDDNILAHGANPNRVGEAYVGNDPENKSAMEKILKGEQFIAYAKSLETGEKSLKAYSPIKFEGIEDKYWSLLSVTSIEYINKQFTEVIIKLILLGIFITFVLSAILYFSISKIVVKPIKVIEVIFEELANYNFDVEGRDKDPKIISVFEKNNEISSMLGSLRTMAINVNSLLTEISRASQNLAATSQELTATADQTSTSSEEVSNSIEEIAKGSTEQANDTALCASKIDAIGKDIEEVTMLINELESSSNNIEKQKNEGFEVLSKLELSSDKSKQSNETVYKVVVGVNESATKIDNASQMIQSIAEQTNLLALNAAIEAARAGEAGKGFAVVAEEIRKLAEQSNGFTEDIKSVIQELIHNSNEAVQTMEGSRNVTDEQIKGVTDTKEKFEKIAEAIEDTKSFISKVGMSAKSVDTHKNEIISIMQGLSTIAEENANNTQQASAFMQEQLAVIQEVANVSEGLSNTAMKLQEEMQKFKV